MQAYCVKCRAKKEMKDPKSITMKNGRPATQGICPTCGTKMFRIGKGQDYFLTGLKIEMKLVNEGFHALDPIISITIQIC